MSRSLLSKIVIATTLLFAASTPAIASVQSITGVTVSMIRVYVVNGTPGGTVFFQISSSSNVCNTNMFSIDIGTTTTPNGRDQYAALLAASMAGKIIDIDTGPSGCTGWGTQVTSIYVHI